MISRRTLGARLAAGTAAAFASPKILVANKPVASPELAPRGFPADFLWGAATSSFQIEGSPKADGKGESIWDQFQRIPGKIKDGSNADTACDSYNRYAEDRKLLTDIGAGAYRMSISWPRIFPQGKGKPNQKGVDHYLRVVDDLLEHGIEPHITLFHWDLPAALEGGWQNRDTAKAFGDYAGYMAGKLSDRVKHFMTMNEIRSFIDFGYGTGMYAPGLKLTAKELNQTRHHALLGHGLAVQAMRASVKNGTKIGIAENPVTGLPVIETEEHIKAARDGTRFANAEFLTAIMEGAYLDSWLAKSGADAPVPAASDMKIIGSPLDFVSINHYSGFYFRANPQAPLGFDYLAAPDDYPTAGLPWIKISPEGMYWTCRFTDELWKPKALYISENGAVAADKLVDGQVNDTARIMFLRNYLTHLQRAIAEGYPVKGYFLWSLLDNFEWSDGFTPRFGIHYTDYATQKRIPKLSSAWYKELIRGNRLVERLQPSTVKNA